MALPSNKIKKIQTPDSTEYDIIPSMLQDGTTSYKLSVPTLSVDLGIVRTITKQTITGVKTFNPSYESTAAMKIHRNGSASSQLSISEAGIDRGTSAAGNAFSLKNGQLDLYYGASCWNLTLDKNGITKRSNPATSYTVNFPASGGTFALTDDINDSAVNNIAPEYSASSTYLVGQKVIYNGQLYECSTRIQSAEAWNSSHWTAIKVSSKFVDLDTAQTISGQKTFSGSVILTNEPLRINSDNYQTHTGDDWDSYIKADKIEIENQDTGNTGELLFPDIEDRTETIATLSDIPTKSTDVNQFGDYYVSPTQVRQYQATLGIIENDLLTNINGHSVSSLYKVDENTSFVAGYPVKKIIKLDNSNLSFDDAHNYMRKMTGSEFAPIFDVSVPQYTYIMDVNGTLYKPQWDSSNGLLLYYMSNIRHWRHNIVIKSTGNLYLSFSFINTNPQPYVRTTTGDSFKEISKAIYNLSFTSASHLLPANGQIASANGLRMIYTIRGHSSGTYLYYNYLDLISLTNSGATATINSSTAVESSSSIIWSNSIISSNCTIIDTVEEC